MSWIYHDEVWTNLDEISEVDICKDVHGYFIRLFFKKPSEDGLNYVYLAGPYFKTKKTAVKLMNEVMSKMVN